MKQSPVHILRVAPRYAPAWRYGGSITFSFDLDAALVARGCAITVFTSDQIDAHTRAAGRLEHLRGIDIERFPNPWNYLASQASWLGLYPRGLRAALRERAGAVDVIHVTEARGPHARWAFAAARTAGVPVVWSPLSGLAEGVGVRRPYRRLYDLRYATRRLVAEARFVVAQSPHEAMVVERLGARASQVRVIGLGVDARRFRVLPAPGAFRRAVGIAPGRPLVLFMGRFHPTKGLDVLLRAIAMTRRTCPDVAAVLVGWDHGALRTVHRLRRQLGLEEAVRVVPPVFEEAAVKAYVDADVFALAATIYEETSLAAMEALAAGTPCVLTRQCEVLGLESMGGGRVTACAPEPFAAGLLAVLNDPLRRERAQGARQTVLGSRTIEQTSDTYAELFREVVGMPAARPDRVAL